MDKVISKNRWFIWAIVAVLAVGLLTYANIQYEIGRIDQQTSELIVQ